MVAGAKDKRSGAFSQLFTFMRDSYLDRTARPVYAVVYLLPFILFYELGTVLINPETLHASLMESQIRVMAFIWMQEFMRLLQFGPRLAWIATPLVVIIILLALQATSKTPWKVHWKDFLPMTVEAVLLAVPLIVLSLVFNRIGQQGPSLLAGQGKNVLLMTAGGTPFWHSQLFVDIVTGIGAGIYEELIFRLVLICVLMFLFQDICKLRRGYAIGLSILISAALFSAHHHFFFINGQFRIGEAFSLGRFSFRLIAGIYFSVIFALRGFGITAGTHAFYDIIAALLNASVFADTV